MLAPLIFAGIFLRGMRKNGGEGGSFDCGNVSTHCQSFFIFLGINLYLTLSIGGVVAITLFWKDPNQTVNDHLNIYCNRTYLINIFDT